jgi:hypothetical protein
MNKLKLRIEGIFFGVVMLLGTLAIAATTGTNIRDVAGLGANVATALGRALNAASGAAGVDSDGKLHTLNGSKLTNVAASSVPITGVSGLGTGVASAAASTVNTAGSLAALDSSAKLPEAQLPASVLPTSGAAAASTVAYSPDGTHISFATLGANMSLVANVLNSTGGGSGTVTEVTSATSDATVANGTTTPAITIVQAPALKSNSTTVNVSAASAPSAGQVLTATDSTHANWQTPTASSGTGVTQILATSGAPVLIPAGNGATATAGLSWTAAHDGTFTLTGTSSQLPSTLPAAWTYIPVGQFDGTNPTTAGLYWGIFTSGTGGKVWLTTPASCTGCPTTTATTGWNGVIGAGGYIPNPGLTTSGWTSPTTTEIFIQQTTGSVAVITLTTPAGMMGLHGFLKIENALRFSPDTLGKSACLGLTANCNNPIYSVSNASATNYAHLAFSELKANGTYSSQIAYPQILINNNSSGSAAYYSAYDFTSSRSLYLVFSLPSGGSAGWIFSNGIDATFVNN